jgi:hypothetical protein
MIVVSRKTRLFVAGLAAFLIGFPLAERSYGQIGSWVGWIIDSSINSSDGES